MTEPTEQKMPDGMAKLAGPCCGCGSPGLFFEAALELLEHFEYHDETRKFDLYEEKYRYFVANALDSIGLLEHGTGIAGSWLTRDGMEALQFLREFGPDWESKGIWVDSSGAHHGSIG